MLNIDVKSNERSERYKIKFISWENKQGFKKYFGIKRNLKTGISPIIDTDRKKILIMKCTKYFFTPFVEKNEGVTTSYKDEEVISILLASKDDVETPISNLKYQKTWVV